MLTSSHFQLYFTLALPNAAVHKQILPSSFASICALITMSAFVLGGSIPLMYELGAEMTYPVPVTTLSPRLPPLLAREGMDGAPHQCLLGAVACCSLCMLTPALLMTSSHSKAGFNIIQRDCPDFERRSFCLFVCCQPVARQRSDEFGHLWRCSAGSRAAGGNKGRLQTTSSRSSRRVQPTQGQLIVILSMCAPLRVRV